MVSKVSLQRYINKCDEIISSDNVKEAEDLQKEIISVFSADLEHLKAGLSNYSFIGAFTSHGQTTYVGDEVDFIKDLSIIRSRLQVELEKIEANERTEGVKNMFETFPTETLILKKKSGEEIAITALVSGDTIGCDQGTVNIEEGDFMVRSLPSGAKECYTVIDRGFFKGNSRIPDHYQSKVRKVDISVMKNSIEMDGLNTVKPHKLFISHSSKDAEYMSALVEMLEDIGMPEGSIVCTSVPGYGIPGGKRIYDWLRNQFLECDLRVLFAFSKDYYNSPACLNEMGAAWVTKATDTLMLLPGFSYNDIKGCADNTEMGISFDSDETELKHRLNELKDTLIEEYHLQQITSTRWERHRDNLIQKFQGITEKRKNDKESSEPEQAPYQPVVGQENVGNIPVESAFLLVYAAAGNGQIMKLSTLGSPVQVSADGKQFMANNSQRESARWQEALDRLITWGWVKPVGRKGEVFEVTGTGYTKANWLKDGMCIDTSKDPLEELKQFEI